MALPSGYVKVAEDTFTEGSDTALASHTPDTDPSGAGWTERDSLTVYGTGDYVASPSNSSDGQGDLGSLTITGDFLLIADVESNGASVGDNTYCGPVVFLSGSGSFGFMQNTSSPGFWRMHHNGPVDGFTTGTTDNFPSGVPSGYQELALERVGDTFKSYVNGTLMQTWDRSGTTDWSGSPSVTPGVSVGTYATGIFPRCTSWELRLPDQDIAVTAASVQITTYAATITGTAFSNDISVGVASVEITTHRATITATRAAALKIGSVEVDVIVGGHSEQSVPMAPEIRRNAQSKSVTSITASRGYKGRWPITTVPMSSTDTDTLEAAITTGLPLTVTGWLVGGSVTAKVVGDVTIEPAGLNYTVSFVLEEQ